jgi:hypothetical protein
VYQWLASRYSLVQTLQHSDTSGTIGNSGFGSALAMSAHGSIVLVGSPKYQRNYGACYAFVKPPVLTLQPLSTIVASNVSASFSIDLEATSEYAIQWQVDATLLSLGEYTMVSGANAPTLTIASPTSTMDGYRFRAVVGLAGFHTRSSSATLTIMTDERMYAVYT